MSEEKKPGRFKLSLDTWAVFVALGLVVLVRSGVVSRVPW